MATAGTTALVTYLYVKPSQLIWRSGTRWLDYMPGYHDTVNFRYIAVEYKTNLNTIRKEGTLNFIRTTNSQKTPHTSPELWGVFSVFVDEKIPRVIVRLAGLLWSQQDFEWWWSVPLSSALLYYSFLLFCLICVYSSQFSILFWIMYLL